MRRYRLARRPAMTGVFRLLRLDVRCPVCGSPPAIKITPGSAAKYESEEPELVVLTYQCQRCARKGQLTYYSITAAAYQGAN